MMTRREIRETSFRILFALNFQSADEMEEQLRLYYEEHTELDVDQLNDEEDDKAKIRIDEESWPQVCEKCMGCASHLTEIDDVVNAASEGWKTTRMTKVDLTLLRLAVYEIRCEKLDRRIAINEAVELAKHYGTPKSPAFVNGVLAKIPSEDAE